MTTATHPPAPIPHQTPDAAAWQQRVRELVELRGGVHLLRREDWAELAVLLHSERRS